ncbi:Uncharacterized membrane protein [Natronoarchaeum philippinense]|uniref:Uncharacterized membrane protein n=1 Tax=Natronoarchaeum philippinense TaxID=558529 RepID=A0A285P801_NATPI|nr:SdpI family protein [Natronoarchaeum philippinense]SNZ17333.1 Uncharacterized membrane protein [Natronoarchaeum philippinense]
MNARNRRAATIALVGIAALASAAVYGDLPAEMAIHWGPSGVADGWADRAVGAFLLPGLMAVLAAVLWAVPRLDPREENYASFRPTYDWFVVGVLALLVYVHGLVLATNLGVDVSMTRALVPAIAALYYGVGHLLDGIAPNWFVGIRTPWTLADDRVWERTHAVGGRLFKLAGVLSLGGLVAGEYAIVFLVGPVLLAALAATAYSYRAYSKLSN